MIQIMEMNHWWQVPLYMTIRGLTISRILYGRRTIVRPGSVEKKAVEVVLQNFDSIWNLS